MDPFYKVSTNVSDKLEMMAGYIKKTVFTKFKEQLGERGANIYLDALLSNKRLFQENQVTDIIKKLNLMDDETFQKIKHALEVTKIPPGFALGSVMVTEFMEPLLQSNLNAKRVKRVDCRSEEENEIIQCVISEIKFEDLRDNITYIFNGSYIDIISQYHEKIKQILNSISFKSKVNELYCFATYKVFNNNFSKLDSNIIYGFHVYKKNTSGIYIGIYYNTKEFKHIFEWLNNITYAATEEQNSITFIYCSDRTLFKSELFIRNFIHFQFIKHTNCIVPKPRNVAEHMHFSMQLIYALNAVKCNKDMNRTGFQNAGVGPFALVVFEGAFKAIERAVMKESEKLWRSNAPNTAMTMNSPIFVAHNCRLFYIDQEI